MRARTRYALAAFVVVGALSSPARRGWGEEKPAQEESAPEDRGEAAPEDQEGAAPEDLGKEPVETDFTETPARRINPNWSEYDLGWLTFKWGIYTIEDWGRAAQSGDVPDEVEVDEGFKVRDFRFSFSGKLATERSITYTMGLMYDGNTNEWFPRETGIQIAIPELWGNVFIGRQKEGISLNKITVGYAVWTMERPPITETSIPILADGIKWLGGLPSHRANWNVAFYYNQLPKGPSTDWYDHAFVARLAVLPLRLEKEGSLLHLAAAYHWGKYADDEAQLRSRPESSTAPFFLDTGTFPADHDNLIGLEAYFIRGSWFAGAEYLFDSVSAPAVGDPLFHGGNAFVTWVITGEERPYIDLGGKVGFVKPRRSVFSGGIGAWEAVLNFTYTDLDSEMVQGGRFWRLTPQLNWYIDDMLSFRVNYGLGRLDRFGTELFTHFLQWRLQFQIQ